MKNYDSLKKRNKSHFALWLAVAVLVALEFCSVSVLFSQMRVFSPTEQRRIIPLTEAAPGTELEIGRRNTQQSVSPVSPAPHRAYHAPAAVRPLVRLDENSDKVGFWTYDENTIWSTHTDIEIFRLRHDNNGDGVYTVVTGNGDKVFAPGTENDYNWSIKNTNTKNLKYVMSVEAYVVVPDGIWLPIQGRIYSHDDAKYLAGSATEWPDVLELDGVTQEGTITAGRVKDYTLQWRWPFERGEQIQEGLYKGDYTEDFYDTMLGNLALDEDLELHIIIRTSAWIDEEGGGHVPTGDDFNPVMWTVVAAISFVGLLFIVFLALKDRKKKEPDQEA